jgi:HSP20 family molecular chaperone IbpA
VEETMAARSPKSPEPQILESDALLDRVNSLNQSIAERAYELFLLRGGEHGHDLDDWLKAESELVQSVPLAIVDTDAQLTVEARVPGFRAEHLGIGIEPRRLIISGTRFIGDIAEQAAAQQATRELFNAFDLPHEIDPRSSKAFMREDTLYLTLPKITQ